VASFPDLGGNAPFMHPSTRTKRYVTDVNKFGDGSEQRNQSASAALVDWDMQFVDIAPHELELVRQFFIDQKGMDGVLWDITVGGTLYSNMTFMGDTFEERESGPDQYEFTLRARQLSA
jgi:hypothetical protein